MANSSTASRPPGASTRCISAQAASVCSTLRMPNAMVTASTAPFMIGHTRRVATNERHAVGETPLQQLLAPDAQHRGGKVDADHARGVRRRGPRGDRQIRGAGAEVQHALVACELQGPDRRATPPPIDASAEQVIQEVVPPRDGIEHCRRCASDSWTDQARKGSWVLGAWVLGALGCFGCWVLSGARCSRSSGALELAAALSARGRVLWMSRHVQLVPARST